MNIGNNKYIHAEQIDSLNGKVGFAVVNNKSDEPIATIEWYPNWRKYVLAPCPNAIFDDTCLTDILEFMKGLA